MPLEQFTPDQHAEALALLKNPSLSELQTYFINTIDSGLRLEDIPNLSAFAFTSYMERLASAEPGNTLFSLLYRSVAISDEAWLAMMAGQTETISDDAPTLVEVGDLNELDQHAFSIARANIGDVLRHVFLGRSTDRILGLLQFVVVTESDGKYCQGIFNYSLDQLSREAIHEKYNALQAQAEHMGLTNLRFGLNVNTKAITISQKITR
jgi:hypothetical protein